MVQNIVQSVDTLVFIEYSEWLSNVYVCDTSGGQDLFNICSRGIVSNRK